MVGGGEREGENKEMVEIKGERKKVLGLGLEPLQKVL